MNFKKKITFSQTSRATQRGTNFFFSKKKLKMAVFNGFFEKKNQIIN
jgi:hypothetical protein